MKWQPARFVRGLYEPRLPADCYVDAIHLVIDGGIRLA